MSIAIIFYTSPCLSDHCVLNLRWLSAQRGFTGVSATHNVAVMLLSVRRCSSTLAHGGLFETERCYQTGLVVVSSSEISPWQPMRTAMVINDEPKIPE